MLLLLLVALFAAYANHFHNGFHFDDAHTIENNAAIRELRNIPLFFRDATTFSSLPSNQSYRPLVSTLLAIDYSSRPRTATVLVSPVDLHAFRRASLLLAFVIHRLLDDAGSVAANGWIALGAAACYGLHPANADTVNYIIASSEVISTLGVIASFAVLLRLPATAPVLSLCSAGSNRYPGKADRGDLSCSLRCFRLPFVPGDVTRDAAKRGSEGCCAVCDLRSDVAASCST